MKHCRRGPGREEWATAARSLPAGWDEALPPDHYLRSSSLAAHEAARLPHVTVRYWCLRDDMAIVAQAAFQVLTIRPEHIDPATLKPWQRSAWRSFTGTLRPKLLVAGHLFRHDVQAFHAAPGVAPFNAFTWYRQAISAAASQCGTQAVLVKEVPEALVPYFQHYAPEYILLRNDSSMQLEVPDSWHQFIDYEKSLKHKYAQRLRKVRQGWAGLTVREWTTGEVTEGAETLYRLYLQVTYHQAVRLGLLSREFIPALKRHYGDRLKVWGIYEGEALIAFASAWVQEESFDMFYIGFDYRQNARLQLYFNILFFAVEQAILLGKRQLILGRTALEAKARVGCRPHYLHTFLHIRNPVLRRIVAALQQKVSAGEGGEWENRHPFK